MAIWPGVTFVSWVSDNSVALCFICAPHPGVKEEEHMGHFYPQWLNGTEHGAAGPLCCTETGPALRSPLTAPAMLNEFCGDYTHGYFRGRFKAKISVLTQIRWAQCALRRISSHPCRCRRFSGWNRARLRIAAFVRDPFSKGYSHWRKCHQYPFVVQ